MKLFGSYTSPYVRHCRIVLLETGLDCVFVEIDHAISAENSPTKRMPYLQDDAVTLTDSSSIVKYFREKSGVAFLPDVIKYDHYCMVNTVMDATVNLFMLEKDGILPSTSSYLMRQKQRINSALEALNQLPLAMQPLYGDEELRLACYLEWALFRERVDLEPYQNLRNFLDSANSYEKFRVTAPRAS